MKLFTSILNIFVIVFVTAISSATYAKKQCTSVANCYSSKQCTAIFNKESSHWHPPGRVSYVCDKHHQCFIGPALKCWNNNGQATKGCIPCKKKK